LYPGPPVRLSRSTQYSPKYAPRFAQLLIEDPELLIGENEFVPLGSGYLSLTSKLIAIVIPDIIIYYLIFEMSLSSIDTMKKYQKPWVSTLHNINLLMQSPP
jgi:hypothetical protein